MIHGLGSSRADRESRVRAALERAGLTPPTSSGTATRTSCPAASASASRSPSALVLEPQMLIADEPVSMLDVSVRAGVLSLLDELRRDGLGILMITHDLATAAHYADRVARHVPRAHRRAGARACGDRRSRAPVHARAGLGRPAPRPASTRGSPDPRRRDAGSDAHPGRLPLPSALPGDAAALPRDRSGTRSRPREPVAVCRMHPACSAAGTPPEPSTR